MFVMKSEIQAQTVWLQHLLGLADGEPGPQCILSMQVREELTVHSVFDRVHHLRLGYHCAALLLHAAGEQLRLERNLCERLQHLRRPDFN